LETILLFKDKFKEFLEKLKEFFKQLKDFSKTQGFANSELEIVAEKCPKKSCYNNFRFNI